MKFNWVHGILIFIILFLMLSVAFIIFALNQPQDLVSEDYYNQGADYTKQMEVNSRSNLYRDSINIALLDKDVQVKLCKSLASSADTIKIYFYRPSDKEADIRMKCLMSEAISIPASKLQHGRYVVKMSWTHRGELFNVDKDLTIE